MKAKKSFSLFSTGFCKVGQFAYKLDMIFFCKKIDLVSDRGFAVNTV